MSSSSSEIAPLSTNMVFIAYLPLSISSSDDVLVDDKKVRIELKKEGMLLISIQPSIDILISTSCVWEGKKPI